MGVAVCGAIFSNRLASELAHATGLGAGGGGGENVTAASLAKLPAPVRDEIIGAYADSLQTVFLVCVPIALVAFVLSWLLPERPLRTTVEASGIGEAFATPKPHDSRTEIERALSTLARRDSRRRILESIVERAGVDLTAPQAWVLARLGEEGPVSADELAARHSVDAGRVAERMDELRARGLAEGDEPRLTPAGNAVLDQLIAARRERLASSWTGGRPSRRRRSPPCSRAWPATSWPITPRPGRAAVGRSRNPCTGA